MKLGKIGKLNKQANAQLKEYFMLMGITRCELCGSDNFLSWAHRHKRVWYRKTPELLSDFNEVLLLCVPCHQKIEYNKTLTEQTFAKLRDSCKLTAKVVKGTCE